MAKKDRIISIRHDILNKMVCHLKCAPITFIPNFCPFKKNHIRHFLLLGQLKCTNILCGTKLRVQNVTKLLY